MDTRLLTLIPVESPAMELYGGEEINENIIQFGIKREIKTIRTHIIVQVFVLVELNMFIVQPSILLFIIELFL